MQTIEALQEAVAQIQEEQNPDKILEGYQEIEKNIFESPREVQAEFYLLFAIFWFQNEVFGQCMDYFIKAQENGYAAEEIKNIVFEAFIQPNEAECQMIYQANIAKLEKSNILDKIPSLDSFSMIFIPTLTKDVVYFYDLNQNKIIKKEWKLKDEMNFKESSLFDDYFYAYSGDMMDLLSWRRKVFKLNKKFYMYLESNLMMDFLSYFQTTQLERQIFLLKDTYIFTSAEQIKDYFTRENIYLPRNIIPLEDKELEAKMHEWIQEIHELRIKDIDRKRNKVLLTIGIPSYNRGNRAYESVIHHLQTVYDDEIEIVVSNNGSDNETKDFYTQISGIQDARLTYFAFESNMTAILNFAQVIDMAKGQFVFMLSDEDTIYLDKISNVLQVIVAYPNLSMIKAYGDGRQIIQNTGFVSQGKEAIAQYAFTANYLSGNVFSTEVLKNTGVVSYVLGHYQENAFLSAYSHVLYELVCCVHGDVFGINDIIFHEGEEEVGDVGYVGSIPEYATSKERIIQHKDFVDVLTESGLFCEELYGIFYRNRCYSTFGLIDIAIRVYYMKQGDDISSILRETYDVCIEHLEKVHKEKNANYHITYEKLTNTYNYLVQKYKTKQ